MSLDKLQIRSLKIQDMNGAEELLNQSFHVKPGASFFDDFPVWNSEHLKSSRSVQMFGAYDGSLLCGTGGVLSIDHISILGGIATKQSYRGRGIATEITKKLLDEAERSGSKAAVLWGSEWELYGRLGFKPIKGQERVLASELGKKLVLPTTLKFGTGFNHSVFTKMRQRKHGFKYQERDFELVKAHKNVEWAWLSEGTELLAFLAYGRGIDLSHRIHEWGMVHEDHLRNLIAWFLEMKAKVEPGCLEKIYILGREDLWSGDAWKRANRHQEVLCLLKEINGGLKDQQALWFWGLDAN